MFIAKPETFLTEVMRCTKDEKMGELLYGFAYDAISLEAPLFIVPDKPSTPSSPGGVGDLKSPSQEKDGGKKRRKRKGGMMAAEDEHPHLKKVIKLALSIALLTSLVGVTYIGFACIRNLMNLYGFDVVTQKMIETVYELTRTTCTDLLFPGTGVAVNGAVTLAHGSGSILSVFGVGVRNIISVAGRAASMTPLIVMGMYMRNVAQLPRDIDGVVDGVRTMAGSIRNTLGESFDTVQQKLIAVRARIRTTIDSQLDRTDAVRAIAEAGLEGIDTRIDNAADRLIDRLNPQHQEEIDDFLRVLTTQLQESRRDAAGAAAQAVSRPYNALKGFLIEMTNSMFEGIVEVVGPELGEEEFDIPEIIPRAARPPDVDAAAMPPPNPFPQPPLGIPEGRRYAFASQPGGPDSPRVGPPQPKLARSSSNPFGGKRSRKRRNSKHKKSRRR